MISVSDNAPQLGGQDRSSGNEPELQGSRPICDRCNRPMGIMEILGIPTESDRRVWVCRDCYSSNAVYFVTDGPGGISVLRMVTSNFQMAIRIDVAARTISDDQNPT